ncbi:MAG: hypothetical protein ACR2OG_14960 [Gemmatimonadaceae bacterium]
MHHVGRACTYLLDYGQPLMAELRDEHRALAPAPAAKPAGWIVRPPRRLRRLPEAPTAPLYWRTAGSLLLVMLLHAAVNNTKDIVPSAVPGATNPLALSTSPVAWLTVAFLWIAGGFFLVRMARGSLPS